jgi:uncharacterized membrane protein YhaH (DUF805 family)
MHPGLIHFFSPRGRLRRLTYYGSVGVLVLLFFVLLTFIESKFGRDATLVLHPFFIVSVVALSARRLHDREQSARWLLLVVVPVLGPLLLAAWLLLGRGTRGPNRFGLDPREVGADYLQVSIDR